MKIVIRIDTSTQYTDEIIKTCILENISRWIIDDFIEDDLHSIQDGMASLLDRYSISSTSADISFLNTMVRKVIYSSLDHVKYDRYRLVGLRATSNRMIFAVREVK